MKLWEKVACVAAFTLAMFSEEIGDYLDRKFPI